MFVVVNIGRWVLRNLFIGFIREEQRSRRHQNSNTNEPQHLQKVPASLHIETNGNLTHRGSSLDMAAQMQAAKPYTSTTVISSTSMIPAVAPSPTSPTSPTARSSPLLTPLIPIHPISKDALHLPAIPQSPLGSHDTTPMPITRHTRSQTAESATQLGSPLAGSKDDYFTVRPRQPNSQDDTAVPQTPLTPGAGLMGRLKSFGGKVGVRKGSGDAVLPSPIVGRTSIPEPKTEVSLLMCLYGGVLC